jgi:sRNA-binding carbon storage regulator CsrA
MKKKTVMMTKLKANESMQIGEVTIKVMKIGESRVHILVFSPEEVKIKKPPTRDGLLTKEMNEKVDRP